MYPVSTGLETEGISLDITTKSRKEELATVPGLNAGLLTMLIHMSVGV